MIKEFSVEFTAADRAEIENLVATTTRVYPEPKPGRQTFAFDEAALTTIANGDFERFLWTAFDRVEERGGVITLAKGTDILFYLPVSKLQDPEIRRAIWNFVSGRVGLHA